MPRTKPPYPPKFRELIIELVRAGRTYDELAKEYEPTEPTIPHGVTQADRNRRIRTDGPAPVPPAATVGAALPGPGAEEVLELLLQGLLDERLQHAADRVRVRGREGTLSGSVLGPTFCGGGHRISPGLSGWQPAVNRVPP
jgi:transposase-like protein